MLYWLLVFSNLIGGFIAASSVIVSKIPELENTANTLGKFKKYVGAAVLLISILNIFNFWTPSYPKLLLLGGLFVGFVLSVDWLKEVNIPEDTRDNIISFAQKSQTIAGLFALIIGLLKILAVILNIVESIL